MLLLCNAALGASAAQAAKRPAPKVVKVTEAKPSAAKAAEEGRVSFTLTVKGEGFGTSADAVSLMLLNADGEDAVASDGTTVESAAPTKIVAHVVASPGPYSLRLKIGKANADTSALGPLAVVTAAGGETQQIAAQPVAPAQPGGIEIETPEAYAHPSDSGLKRYSLVVKRKSGEYFATDPKLVSLVLIPAGASDVTIRRVTPTRIEADFWAPDKYQIKDAGVTVYDRNNPQLIAASSDIEVKDGDTKDKNNAKNSNVNATASNEKGSADDVEPAITSTAVVFLQRAYGIGRLKIEGKNFGNYKAPPISAEDYLLCFEPLARQALYRALEESKHPDIKAQQAYEDQRCVLSNSPKTVKTSADKGASDADKSGADKNGSTLEQWRTWRAEIEKRVKVALVPKNTDLRIEQTKILYVDDKLIDVYFEFNRYFRNSEPLRLASATVTVKKPEQQKQEKKQQATNGQTVASSGNGADGTNVINAAMITNSSSGEKKDAPKSEPKEPDCDLGPCKTYIASSDVGATQGLEYTYNVLDNESSAMLFGKGVAGNFYAILLSVTNNGDRKISIPLSSIRAEIEWAYGSGDSKSGKGSKAAKANDNDSTATESDDKDSSTAKQGVKKSANGTLDAMSYVDADDSTTATPIRIPSAPSLTTYYYEEGPVTLAPLSLQTVTAFFDGDEKVNGKKAKLFNYFDGAAILGSSLFPFFGPGFRDAHGAFTGGLIPGLKRGLGDLSGQQLQNLTGMSWQDIEVVGAKGGSVVKYIFIQRGDSSFSPGFNESIKKTIKNIQGMEVKGIEVIEGDTKTAAHTGQQ
jgi:hypothetical protein